MRPPDEAARVRRRALVGGLASLAVCGLGGCGLSERPYAERREWPLLVRRPATLPPRGGGKLLLVRSLRAGPGMAARGLQSLQPDGSIKTAFYEEWAVPPAEAVEDALRRWLAESGVFAAVLAPGSRLPADLVLEGELDALWTEAARGDGYAALGVTVLAPDGQADRVRLQRTISARAPVAGAGAGAGAGAAANVAAMRAAVAEVFGRIEALLAG